MTTELQRRLSLVAHLAQDVAQIDEADAPHVLARHVQQATQLALEASRDANQRLDLINQLLDVLQARGSQVQAPARQLLRVAAPSGPGVAATTTARPSTPLAEAALLTNSPNEPSLGTELRAEIESADEVDLLCAFVKWHGLRVLEGSLKWVVHSARPFRVVTTTYMGATERRALDRLVRDFGAQVRIQYDNERTRLHAKAWLFRRNTGFDTAYVGSSNLSNAALLDGVEWNVRLSRVATPTLLDTFRRTFDRYWNDPSFIPYDPDLVEDRDRVDDALAEASGRATRSQTVIALSGLEVRPRPHQLAMLEALDTERVEHDRHRNLLVAATGTGKTVVAAFDYQRLRAAGRCGSLLFVAHRREILGQSLRTFREVLGDGDFGELYVAGARPERWRHVFASVQSLTSYGVTNIPSDAFDLVIVDEFHHVEAPTYQRILDHLAPRELLGLTATPERADGVNVQDLFGGRIASELRLWDALESDLLCPFHYFVVSDGTDLRRIAWKRGRYDDAELSDLYTGNKARAALVLRELRDKVLDPGAMRALGFCVSVSHAEFMAEVFTQAGIPARSVSGSTPPAQRDQALQDLRRRDVNVLFAADLFNEGLDIPDVDTILFLRPTESATIFLQQLGRGLRRTHDKPVLTALDFVGHQRTEFRFDLKLRALTGQSRRALADQVEKGFPFLPSGTQIVLDRQSQEVVVANLKAQISNRWPKMGQELRRLGDIGLGEYLHETGLDLSDVLRNNHSWTELRRQAGLPTSGDGPAGEKILRRVRAFAHVDDSLRVESYCRLLADDGPAYEELSVGKQRLARMLTSSVWPDRQGEALAADGLSALRSEPAVRHELRTVIDLAWDASRLRAVESADVGLAGLPLRVHARYSREEILAALDRPGSASSFREGVYYSEQHNIDAFFVTLVKSEKDYSPSTMYRDYVVSPTLFHWESQSTTSADSPTGRRYLGGTSTVVLFVRERQQNDFGTAPYLCLGSARSVGHEGEKPIAITWELEHQIPEGALTGG